MATISGQSRLCGDQKLLQLLIPPLRESDTIAWVISLSTSVMSLESPMAMALVQARLQLLGNICMMCVEGRKKGLTTLFSRQLQVTGTFRAHMLRCFSHSMLCIDDDGNGNHGKLSSFVLVSVFHFCPDHFTLARLLGSCISLPNFFSYYEVTFKNICCV